jgi:hypothetical protein
MTDLDHLDDLTAYGWQGVHPDLAHLEGKFRYARFVLAAKSWAEVAKATGDPEIKFKGHRTTSGAEVDVAFQNAGTVMWRAAYDPDYEWKPM